MIPLTTVDPVRNSERGSPLRSDKMLQHLDRLASWQAGEMPAPVTVELNLTNSCNHACPGCTFSYLVNKDRSSLPFVMAGHILSQLAEFGVKAITFSGGGEPLVYGPDRVLHLMRYARYLGLDVALITNGSLLRDPEFLDLCTWTRVSLDAYDADTFQRFHGRSEGEFLKVVTNIQEMSSLLLRSDKKRSDLGVGFLTDRQSIARCDITKMTNFCLESLPHISYVQFRPMVTNMVDDSSLTGGYKSFSEEEYHDIRREVELSRAIAGDRLRVLWSEEKYAALSEEGFGRNYKWCHAHFLQATIAADGKVYMCCHGQGLEKWCLGDLRDGLFRDIWHSERANEVKARINPSSMCPPACRLHSQNRALEGIINPVEHGNFI